MNLIFKLGTEKDIPVIAALAYKIWHEHYPSIITHEQIDYMLNMWNSEDATTQQLKAGVRFFIAWLDDEPVAYAGIQVKGGYNFLNKFYVDVAHHRGGIGKDFFAYLLQQMNRALPVKLQVNRQNYKAINFYFKNGFTIEQVADFDIGNNYYMNDFVMVKQAM
jgi:GNAT superfamily N-acetyltransferase